MTAITEVKRGLVVSGVALVLAILLSSPTAAQTPAQPVNASPAPAVTQDAAAAEPDAAAPLDAQIEAATTSADRMKLLLRCSGPPPRLTAEEQQKRRAALEAFAAEAKEKPAG